MFSGKTCFLLMRAVKKGAFSVHSPLAGVKIEICGLKGAFTVEHWRSVRPMHTSQTDDRASTRDELEPGDFSDRSRTPRI